MSKIPLNKIFKIDYGNSFDLTTLELCDELNEHKVNYVSRTRENNGISAIVKRLNEIEPFSAGLVTVAGSGNSVLESFIQPQPFYTGYHVFVLTPISKMTDREKLFYCFCIRQNQYKYSFGRQANRTLKNLLVPSEVPEWVNEIDIPQYKDISKPVSDEKIQLNVKEWKWFTINDLFDVKYGVNLELNAMTLKADGIPFVSRTSNNNGVSAYVELIDNVLPNPANTISISGGGSVLECFVQESEYYSGRDLFYLKPKTRMSKNVLFFISTIIRQEKYRFNYGRQANKTLRLLDIKLPSLKDNSPDFEFMDRFIKSLPFSMALQNNDKQIIKPEIKKIENQRGLSDEELIKKYEGGKVPMRKMMKAMLKTKPPEKAEKK